MGFKFPYGNNQQLNLNWFIKKFKELLVDWQREKDSIDGALDAEIQRAEDALSDVYAARDATVAAKNDALQAKADALTAAANAAQYWQNAAASANSAATSAVTALQAAQDAADDADQTSRDRALVSADKAAVAADKATVASDKATVAADKAAVQQDKDDTDLLKDAANAAALRSEGWAVGTQNGEPAGSPYLNNNAKYYKDEAQTILDSIPEDYSDLTAEVASQAGKITELASGLYTPFSVLPLYETYSFDRQSTGGGQYITLKNNLILVEKNSSANVAWRDVHFMLPLTGSVAHTSTPSILQNNTDKFQPCLFNNVRAICKTDKNDLYVTAILISSIQNGSVVTRTVNNDFANGQEIITPLTQAEIDSNKILISIRIRSNSASPTANAKIIIDFLNTNSAYEKINKSIMAKVNNTMTADTSLAVNDFRIVGNSLYRITSPIASGGTLTPNTNCVKTTIGAEITAILNS